MSTESIRQLLHNAIIAYYGMSTPIMSDEEFDTLFAQIYPDVEPFEVYKRIYSGNNRERKLRIPMLSLSKVRTENHNVLYKKIDYWLDNGATGIFLTPKFDGLACLITTDGSGEVLEAVTRGNGSVGQDITFVVSRIPHEAFPPNSNIQCEILLPSENLKKAEEITGNKYSNPRNAASGLVRLSNNKTPQVAQLLYLERHFDAQSEYAQSIPIQQAKDTIDENIAEYKNILDNLSVSTDGVVITAVRGDDICRYLGDDGSTPRWAAAWKFTDNELPAVISRVEWTTGRVKNTPVAVFDPPVDFGGHIVDRCSLHNMDTINTLGVAIGDVVALKLSGMVIPYISSVLSEGADRTLIVEPEGLDNNGLAYCSNVVDKLEIYGLGDVLTEHLHDVSVEKYPHDVVPIAVVKYLLDIREDKDILLGFPRVKEGKSLDNIYNSICSSLDDVTDTKLIALLGIKYIGTSLSKAIVATYSTRDELLNDLREENLKDVPLLGAIKKKTLLENSDSIIEVLSLFVENLDGYNTSVQEETHVGKIVVTGKFDVPRGVIEEQASSIGFECGKSVSKDTDYLITNDAGSTSSKMKKAQKLNIVIKEFQTSEDIIKFLKSVKNK